MKRVREMRETAAHLEPRGLIDDGFAPDIARLQEPIAPNRL